MFNPHHVVRLLRQRPFTPLELKFSDGTIEVVRHPDNVIVFKSELGIAQYSEGEELAEYLKLYSLAHLVSVQPATESLGKTNR